MSTDEPDDLPPSDGRVIARIERAERDLNALFERSREHDAQIKLMQLAHDDSVKRINLLERAVSDQHRENVRTHQDIDSLKNAVKSLGDRIDGVVRSIVALGTKFDQQREVIEDLFTKQARLHEEGMAWQEQRTKRHERLMRLGLTVAFSLSGLVVVLSGLHAAVTDTSVLEAVKGLVRP